MSANSNDELVGFSCHNGQGGGKLAIEDKPLDSVHRVKVILHLKVFYAFDNFMNSACLN